MGDRDAKMRKEIKSAKAKHGLSKKWDKSNWSLIFERPNRRERGEEEKREEEEEEKKRSQDKKGMELYGILKF